MKPEEKEAARLMFIALLKAISEHATIITGEFKMTLKYDFNNLILQCDRLVIDLERRLNDSQKEYIQNVTDVYHNINIEMRKEAVKKYQELLESEKQNA